MYALVVLSAVLAVASAGFLGAAPFAAAPLVSAPLLPRVQVAPAQVNVVKQPITVQQPEYRIRQVPVPVAAVSYAAPAVTYAAAPAVSYAAAPAISYAAAPAISYGAAPAISYATAPAISYAAAPGLAYSAGIASPFAYSSIASPAIVKVH